MERARSSSGERFSKGGCQDLVSNCVGSSSVCGLPCGTLGLRSRTEERLGMAVPNEEFFADAETGDEMEALKFSTIFCILSAATVASTFRIVATAISLNGISRSDRNVCSRVVDTPEERLLPHSSSERELVCDVGFWHNFCNRCVLSLLSRCGVSTTSTFDNGCGVAAPGKASEIRGDLNPKLAFGLVCRANGLVGLFIHGGDLSPTGLCLL